jgi:hypothetical protein
LADRELLSVRTTCAAACDPEELKIGLKRGLATGGAVV